MSLEEVEASMRSEMSSLHTKGSALLPPVSVYCCKEAAVLLNRSTTRVLWGGGGAGIFILGFGAAVACPHQAAYPIGFSIAWEENTKKKTH